MLTQAEGLPPARPQARWHASRGVSFVPQLVQRSSLRPQVLAAELPDRRLLMATS